MTQSDEYYETLQDPTLCHATFPRLDDFCASGDDFGLACLAAQEAQDCAPACHPPPTKRAFPTGMPATAVSTDRERMDRGGVTVCMFSYCCTTGCHADAVLL